ncbi:MAG: hypothetical protein AB8C84_01405 [Oligoflexales bacterium]
MKKTIMLSLILCVLSSGRAVGSQMIGVQLYDFVGVSWLDLDGLEGYQVDFGWAFDQKTIHVVGAGYKMYVFPRKVMIGDFPLDGFAGYGAKVTTSSNFLTEIRTPAGFIYRIPKASLHIALGLSPVLGIYPSTWFGVSGLLAIRYHL